MATPSSQTILTSESKMVPELRPVMPTDLFNAAIKGNSDVLIQRLGLQPEQQTEISVTIETSDPAPQQINTLHQAVQSELQSATRFGDTVLHLLVTYRHNELALKVFERDMSLLKAKNNMLETPLYCAAKFGNNEVIKKLIRINSLVVKDALNATNENGDTAMHIAANNGHEDVGRELMTLDPEVAYKVNNKMLTPLYMAMVNKNINMEPITRFVVNKNINMVQTMLRVDRTLACTQFSDGMFPVHVAASLGYHDLLEHFFSDYPDYAELLDPRGRNVFHIAAEQGHDFIIRDAFNIFSVGAIARMCSASDCEGNTPSNIARMKENLFIMAMILCLEENIGINHVLTPGKLSSRWHQLIRREHYISNDDDNKDKNRWDKIQVVGLGSVLITTVAFAASFTVPGGYNQDSGMPVLGRRYMFWAYILANALAFIQGFVSLFALLLNAIRPMPPTVIDFAVMFFLFAASSMVLAFGLGLYMTLASLCLPIAILLLVITLFLASPALFYVFTSDRHIPMFVRMLDRRWRALAAYMVPLMLIFGLALMSL